ncbi:hypothetical protein [Rhizobium wenxiniae]|uniref:hypothetical protein n=1 Tax=Rhizobium wenxiniae TaxID=1737357 RepID=UPI003C14C783
MRFRTLFVCGISCWPTVAAAIDVPQGEQERTAWCAKYVTVLEPRRPKFMSGSPLNQEFWKNNTPAAVQQKQLADFEADLQDFKDKTAINNERVRLCSSWGLRAN